LQVVAAKEKALWSLYIVTGGESFFEGPIQTWSMLLMEGDKML